MSTSDGNALRFRAIQIEYFDSTITSPHLEALLRTSVDAAPSAIELIHNITGQER